MRRLAKIAGTAACAVLLWASAAGAAAPFSRSGSLTEAMQLRGELEQPLAEVPLPLELIRRGPVDRLELENRDGYRLDVYAYGQTVLLDVSRDRRALVSTVYLAHGTVTPTSIRASFADRGRIAVRFRPSGRALGLPGRLGCVAPGRTAIARLGVYVGELSFRGEGGYTSARVHRAKGSVLGTAPQASCGRRARARRARLASPFAGPRLAAAPSRQAFGVPGVATHPSAGPKLTTLIADGKLPLSRTLFAAQARDSSRARFLAVEESSEGPIAIIRYAIARAPSSAFRADEALSAASVAPPAPFRGAGALQHGAGGGRSWTGSLAVSFLGAPNVPLTGALFKASLTRSW
jgi:hypothetical protein